MACIGKSASWCFYRPNFSSSDGILDVVKFVYRDYDALIECITWKCRCCGATISDKLGTTCGFVVGGSPAPVIRERCTSRPTDYKPIYSAYTDSEI